MSLTVPAATAGRFLRSVRLERDAGHAESLQGYILTPQARIVLRRILTALSEGGTERALTLTGPYGTGKSAFALFLTELLHDPVGPAFALIERVDGALALEVQRVLQAPFLTVPLTLRRARLGVTLHEGLVAAAESLPDPAALLETLQAVMPAADLETLDTRALLQAVQAVQTHAEAAGYAGVAIVFDELGKALEHEARFEGADIYLLQELAESAARSGAQPLLFVGVLHQAFEQYGEALLASARKEWAKVQGRFADIAFIEPPEQQMRLAAHATATLDPLPGADVRASARNAAQALIKLKQAPLGFEAAEFETVAVEAAPLHPAALMALPYLFRRFAQNERSLFAYLLSGEPHAVPAQWTAGHTLVRMHDLFDYFSINLLGSLSRQAFARRWLEVVDAVERYPDLSLLEVQALKTVGLLGVLGDMTGLHASAELVSVALTDTVDDAEVLRTLQHLEHRSLIVYRRYNRTYRVWEGSDIDIEERLEEGRRTIGAQLALSEVLENYLPRRPLVARRHSFHTGSLRFVEVRYVDAPVSADQLRATEGADGILVCALPSTPEQAEAFARWAQDESVAQRPNLLLAVPLGLQTLREAATELRALYWLRESTPDLRDDRVARREVAERLAYLEGVLISATEHLLDPRPVPVGSGTQYWHRGVAQAVRTPRQATQLLSDALDAVYPASPHVINELINRRMLSSAAAAARRSLIELMLNRGDEALLGLDPELFPPERSMYESVLRFAELHGPVDPDDEAGPWEFRAPQEEGSANLAPAWAELSRLVFEADEPIAINTLFSALAAPPFGVTAGLAPVLLVAFLQVHPHEISMYREAVFVAEPNIADFEVLLRRPELFAVVGSSVRGERAAVLTRLAGSLKTPDALVPVVRALIRMVKGLPETSWRTRSLPDPVVRLRDAFERARSPERLLFQDVPEALGLPAIGSGPADGEQITVFFEALNQALQTWAAHGPAQVTQARRILLEALDFPATDQGWAQLTEQAQALQGRPLPTALVVFVNRLCTVGEPSAVLDGVLSLVAGRSPRSWTDADAARYPSQVADLGRMYRLSARQLGYSTPAAEEASRMVATQLRAFLSAQSSAGQKDAVKLALLQLLQELDDE
ncbi:hypothetical protein [Deinococcus humi]|uniref:ATP-binding protein n=1 Tax=Deinococcus humi TaxID=662880 RepID=A0A7W8K1E3_9DEIO|nr:hypothetical protein [Deinococcus humi]MBB5365711.1 hypothetical protein [Deinococcus humi]GGO38491.1 hypothetical protein GCM10008949_45140 [Deinococcus humi]